jgi:glutaredoxin
MSIDIKILQSACCGPAFPVKEEILNAAGMAGVEVTIDEPSEIQEIMKYGTLTFPSIVVNGKVHDYRKFEKIDDLVNLLRTQRVG